MGGAIADAAFLLLAALCVPLRAFRMELKAPAAAPDPFVPLDKGSEVWPRRGVQ
jgi:hypothetical protein